MLSRYATLMACAESFSRLSFNFKHLFCFFLSDVPVTTALAAPCKKSRQISAKLCSYLSIQPAAIKMEAGWMEYEICGTDTWLSAGWGWYFSWCIKCSLNRSVWWNWLCQHSFDTVVSLLWAWQKCILIYWIPAVTAARNGQEKLSKDAKTGLWSIDNHSVFSKERR